MRSTVDNLTTPSQRPGYPFGSLNPCTQWPPLHERNRGIYRVIFETGGIIQAGALELFAKKRAVQPMS
jgi:hypothetical protein